MSAHRQYIKRDAERLADMARRIEGNGGEPYYCSEKAESAAHAAVRILAWCDVRLGDDAAWTALGERLRATYEREYEAAIGIGERA